MSSILNPDVPPVGPATIARGEAPDALECTEFSTPLSHFYTMNTFEIVALNPETKSFNILEAGYDSFQHARKNREHWVMRFPHLWIEVITRNERMAMVATEGLNKSNLI